jgi:MarR family transcriptional regulator, temperature-dependent positive regulator of motility
LDASPPEPTIASLELMRLLEEHPDCSQRELSRRMGVSLGKTHYLLRALLEKGWVKVQNFSRSDRKLRYAYVLTPNGMRERMKLTRAFLARKENEYLELKTQISMLRDELAEQEGGLQ